MCWAFALGSSGLRFSFVTTGSRFVASISGLVVEYIVGIDVTRVRFPADAFLVRCGVAGLSCWYRLFVWLVGFVFAALPCPL